MPTYTITAPNGKTYDIEGPAGATRAQVIAEIMRRDPSAGEPAQPAAPAGNPNANKTSIGDLGTSLKQGALSSTKALTNVFGADNAASRALQARVDKAQTEFSPARQEELKMQAERMRAAEASGSMMEEIKAAAKSVAEAPLQTAAQAIGSFAPYLPTMFLGPAAAALGLGAKSAAVAASISRVAPKYIGTAQGMGAVKGAIYDGVYREELKAGTDDATAKDKAQKAQEFFGANTDQIVLGGGLGFLAGSTGVEKLLVPGAVRAAGLLPRVLGTAVPELITEAAQGGQERLAQNVALQREGFDVPTFQGVAGGATQEGLAGALGSGVVAAALGPARAPQETPGDAETTQEEADQRAREDARAAGRTERADAEVGPEALRGRSYGDLTQQLEELKTQRRTPDIAEQMRLIRAQMDEMNVQAVNAQREATIQARREAGMAERSAFSATDPQQVEIGGFGRPGIVPQPAADVEPVAATTQELEAAGQEPLPLRRTPEGTETSPVVPSDPQQLEMFGTPGTLPQPQAAVDTPATTQELEAAGQQRLPLRRTPGGTETSPVIPEPVLRTKPEKLAPPEINVEDVGEGVVAYGQGTKGQAFITEVLALREAGTQTPETRKDLVGKSTNKAVIYDALISQVPPTPVAETAAEPVDAEPVDAAPVEETAAEPVPTEPTLTAGTAESNATAETIRPADEPAATGTTPRVQTLLDRVNNETDDVLYTSALEELKAGAAGKSEAKYTPAEREQLGQYIASESAASPSFARDFGGAVFRTAQATAAPTTPVTPDSLRQTIAQVTRSLGIPNDTISVRDSVAEVDPSQAPGSRAGAFVDGQAFVFADGVSTGIEGRKTIFHELFHKGLRALFPGAEYVRVMTSLYNQSKPVQDLANAWLDNAQNKADVAGMPVPMRRAVAVDEILAGMAETRKTPTLLRQLGNWMAGIAQRMGMTDLATNIRIMGMGPLEAFIDTALRAAGNKNPLSSPAASSSTRFSTASPSANPTVQQARDIVNRLVPAAAPTPGIIDVTRDALTSAAQNPRQALRSVREATASIAERFGQSIWSNNTILTANIARATVAANMTAPQQTDMLLQVSTHLAVHAGHTADLAMTEGSLRYDPTTYGWKTVRSQFNLPNFQEALDKVATKYGVSIEEAERMWHASSEAGRVQELRANNNRAELAAQAFEARGDAAGAKRLRDTKKVLQRTLAQEREGLDLYRLMPELLEASRIWDGFRGNMLDIMVEGGMTSQAEAEALFDNAAYVPFYRDEQLESSAGPKTFISGLRVQREKGMTGSEKPVANLIDNIVRWSHYAAERAIRNRKALDMMDASVEMGLATPIQGKPQRGVNSARVYREGKEEFYDVQVPGMMEAFSGIESIAIPLLNPFTKIANLLRANIVLNPLFSLVQVPQDAFAAMFTSGLQPKFALSIPMRAMREFAKVSVTGTSQTFEELRKFSITGQKDISAAVRRNDSNTRVGLGSQPTYVRKALSKLHQISMASDNAVRQAVYEAAMEQGVPRAQAMRKATEIINFRYRGTNGAIGVLSQVIPFMTAYLAATNVMYKTITGTGVAPAERKAALGTLAATTAVVTALSAIYAMMVSGHEDYEEVPAYKRDRVLLVPGLGVSIPLRNDLFLLPKITGEYLWNSLADNGMTDSAKFKTAVRDSVVNSMFSPTAVPQLLKPAAEVMANYSFFTKRALISPYVQQVDASLQFSDSTSELSKALAPMFGRNLVSPIAMDHLIRGYLGTTGGLLLYGTNKIFGELGDVERADLNFRDAIATFPGLGSLVTRENESGLEADFYQLRDVTLRAKRSLDNIESRRPQQRESYLAQPNVLARLELSGTVESINTDLAAINKEIRGLNALPAAAISAAEKGAAVDELKRLRSELLKNVRLPEMREKADLFSILGG